MGKEKIHLDSILSYLPADPRALTALGLCIAALAAGCAAGPPDHFAGLLQPQAGTCDLPGRAELILNESHVLLRREKESSPSMARWPPMARSARPPFRTAWTTHPTVKPSMAN
jgi:hypothetical protein